MFLLDLFVVVERDMNDVERKPTSDKDKRHGHQHAVCALLLCHLLSCVLTGAQVRLHRHPHLHSVTLYIHSI